MYCHGGGGADHSSRGSLVRGINSGDLVPGNLQGSWEGLCIWCPDLDFCMTTCEEGTIIRT